MKALLLIANVLMFSVCVATAAWQRATIYYLPWELETRANLTPERARHLASDSRSARPGSRFSVAHVGIRQIDGAITVSSLLSVMALPTLLIVGSASPYPDAKRISQERLSEPQLRIANALCGPIFARPRNTVCGEVFDG